MGGLDGLRVVDFSPTRVGAQVSQLFADFGADVVWVEPPGGGGLRRQPSFPFLARGKRSVVLDLKAEADVDTARRLAAGADVLIETFRPGVADRLGLGFDELQRVNPRLIYTSITGFGRQGPYAHVKGYEHLVMAKLGVLEAFHKMHGLPHPPYVAAPWCTFSASQTALHGVLAALLERERSGLGQWVEASLAQGVASLDTWAWFLQLVADRWPDAFTPVQAFSKDGVPNSPLMYMLLICLTKDGRWLQFAQVAPHLYAAFMRALGLDWMFADPAWQGIPVFDDEERRLDLWVRMLEAAGTKTLADWEAVFEADPNVFAELFRSGPEVLDHPQLAHDRQVVEIPDPERGPVRQPAALARLDRVASRLDRPAPSIGDYAPADLGDLRPTEPPTDAPTRMPLEGITILELAVLYAAPYGATLLTDLGARVIKVEALTGDPIRMMVGFPEAGGAKVMQGKESIAVDITQPEGLAIVLQLAERADAVLEGFRAGTAERHGLDPASLQAVNPDIVYVSANGYGPGEPFGGRAAFAPSIAAAGGLARANLGVTVPEQVGLGTDAIREAAIRLAGSGTVTSAQADGFAALGVATSLLLGLLARARDGGPQHVLSSMLSTCSHAMAEHVVDFAGNPGPPDPGPELRGPSALYRTYDAADGWVFLAAPQSREWDALATALAGQVDLRADDRFATEDSRRRNDAGLAEVLAGVFAARPKEAWERELVAAGVGCVAVTTRSIESTLMSDEFGRVSGYLADVEHPTFDRHPRLAPLVRFSRSATQAKAGVLKGSHTDTILEELGYGNDAIADLRSRDVIA